MKSKKLLRPEEYAEGTGLRLSTVRRHILERRIETVKIGRSVRIPIEEMERVINEGFRPRLQSTSAGAGK